MNGVAPDNKHDEEYPTTLRGFDDYFLSLGDILRGERATLGKTLEEVEKDIRISAHVIYAIENGDLSVFVSPAFVAGQVRSYARYLGLNQDDVFKQFCEETGFNTEHSNSFNIKNKTSVEYLAQDEGYSRNDSLQGSRFSFQREASSWRQMDIGLLGSFTAFLAVVGLVGYGGWLLMVEIQRIELSPVEDVPMVVSEVPDLAIDNVNERPALAKLESVDERRALLNAIAKAVKPAVNQEPIAAGRLISSQTLDVPVFTPRDGPISAINVERLSQQEGSANNNLILSASNTKNKVVVAEEKPPSVDILAIRPAWIRVTSQDGSVLLEKILDAGELWRVPSLKVAPVLHAGNAGSVYFVVDDQHYGPAGVGSKVVKDISLASGAVSTSFAVADFTKNPALSGVTDITGVAFEIGDQNPASQ